MFSVKLNAPVLLRKQLPVIAKALHVDEKVLEDFMTVSAFYGVKDGKGTIVPIKKTDTIVYIDYKAYDSCYFVVDAILQYAKDIDTSVTLPVITEIELGTDVFKKFSPVQLSDIMFLTRRLKDGNERVTKLAELNAPDILLAMSVRYYARMWNPSRIMNTHQNQTGTLTDMCAPPYMISGIRFLTAG